MTLHVVSGPSVVGTMMATDLAGDFLSWDDVLIDGPVPAGVDDRELRRIRAAFFARSGRHYQVGALTYFTARDRALQGSDDILLWFDAGLFCQLQLIQILAALRSSWQRARLICIDSFPGYPGFVGLGQLNPEELSTLLESAHALTEGEAVLGAQAWEAFRSPDPTAVERLVAADMSALPFLGDAFVRHLEELPSSRDGLSRTERTILRLVGAGTKRWTHLFGQFHEVEERPFMDDLTFRRRLEGLITASTPLIHGHSGGFLELMRRLRKGGPLEQELWPAAAADDLSLTEAGEAVLAGEADAVELNGLDRWLGGVHLEGHAPAWRWDDRDRRVVPTE